MYLWLTEGKGKTLREWGKQNRKTGKNQASGLSLVLEGATGNSGAWIALQNCPLLELREGPFESISVCHWLWITHSCESFHLFSWEHVCVCVCWAGRPELVSAISHQPSTLTAVKKWVHQPVKESRWVTNRTHYRSIVNNYARTISSKPGLLVTLFMFLTLPAIL